MESEISHSDDAKPKDRRALTSPVNGKLGGRRQIDIDRQRVRQMKADGRNLTQIAALLRIDRSTLWRRCQRWDEMNTI